VIRGAAEALRRAASWAPVLGLTPRPRPAREGISAIVRVRGEEEWLGPSLASIMAFADEILVLDNGAAPAAREAIERQRREAPDRVRVERADGLDIFALSNRALELARCRWVIRWDADFVAHTAGPGDIAELRRALCRMDARRYHLVYVPAAEVAGDLRHQFADRRIRVDGTVHTASPAARFVRVEREVARDRLDVADALMRADRPLRFALETLRVPKYYRIDRWPAVAYFHVHVKSARHMLLRHFWLEWLADGAPAETLEAYTRRAVRRLWGTDDLERAAADFIARHCARLVPVDERITGPYPELLRPYLARPRYDVRYLDGAIVGRDES
jgi:glycosyltransferase involved in cell wall biosynthesis